MSGEGRHGESFDADALLRRLLRAVPWAVAAALLASGVAAVVDARVPPLYQSSLLLRLTPPGGPLPRGVSWPTLAGDVQALLLGAGTRHAVSKDPESRAALGASDGAEGEARFDEEYSRRISVLPGTTARTAWVVARDTDPGRARRLASRVAEAGAALFRASLLGARDRLSAGWDREQADHLDEIRRIDADLARRAGHRSGETLPAAEVEMLLARRRVRVTALEKIESQRLAVGAAVDADGGPWTAEEPSGASGDVVPRDRIRPLAGPALFAAALAFLVRLLRDGQPRRS